MKVLLLSKAFVFVKTCYGDICIFAQILGEIASLVSLSDIQDECRVLT